MTAAPPRPLVVELALRDGPTGLARRLLHLPHLALLASAGDRGPRGRYSYLTADPLLWRDGRVEDGDGEDPFALAATWLEGHHAATLSGLPPFQGGVVGLFGYGLNRTVEAIPASRFDEFAAPDFALGLYDWVVSFDRVQRRAWLVVHAHGLGPRDPADRLRQVQAWLAAPPRPLPAVNVLSPLTEFAPQFPLPGSPGVTSNFDRGGYLAAVRRAVEYVHAGDCFQVNLSQRLLTPLAEHPYLLCERLLERNPAPFAAYFDTGDFQVVSASPERFLEVTRSGEVVTRPIKGTRPRGKTLAADAELLRDLTTSAKDRAENVMIVDLLRNDLGRVCEFGSVTVPKVCEVESFASVHHLVSEVRGTLRPGLTALDALRAAFPGGSVTGAPKVRAMEVIAELEPTARGPYCGGLGYVGFDGAADTSILIRTLTAGRGHWQFPVGGGITADSDPAAEYEETLHKAAGLLRALTP